MVAVNFFRLLSPQFAVWRLGTQFRLMRFGLCRWVVTVPTHRIRATGQLQTCFIGNSLENLRFTLRLIDDLTLGERSVVFFIEQYIVRLHTGLISTFRTLGVVPLSLSN